jgi:hypothetical protein
MDEFWNMKWIFPLVDGWMDGCLLEYEMDIPLVGGWMDDCWNMKWIFL